MGEKEKKDEELEKENIISDIIFKGYGTKVINKFDKEWEFRTLSSEEYKKVWSIASIEDDDATNYMVLKKTMLQSALLSINHVEPTSVMKDKSFHQKLLTYYIKNIKNWNKYKCKQPQMLI